VSVRPSARNGYTIEHVDGRLELRASDGGAGMHLKLDDVRRRVRQGRKLALAKACGVRSGLRVLDGMAGFGLDGITLATLGCRVLMVERDPLLYALLADAIERAAATIDMAGTIECREGDIRERRRHDADLFAPDWRILGRSVRFDVYRGTAPTESG